MEKKTIVKLAVSAVLVILAVIFGCGLGRGGEVTYQLPGPYTAESTNSFSTVQVAMTIQDDKITDCEITSSGDSDLLNDEIRAEWAQAIVEAQSADTDVITGATLTYSAASVQEAVNAILVEAGLREPAAEVEEPAEEEAEASAEEAAEEAAEETAEEATEETTEEATEEAPAEGGLADGSYTAEAVNDFSTVKVDATVEGGVITAATVTSSGDNDLLTDELRAAWGDAIVKAQSADADAITGATLAFSAASVKEAVDDILAQAASGSAGEVPAEEAAEGGLADGSYTAEAVNDFSTVKVDATVEGGVITAATVTSSGDNDLLTDELRAAWGDAIVEAQSAEADAITGATLAFSAASVKEAVDDILAQAASGSAEEAPAADDGKIAELEAALAEAEARAAEAEAKVAELEAAAATEEAPAEEAAEAVIEEAPAEEAAEAVTEEAPIEEAAEEVAEAVIEEVEAAEEDASRFMRARPAIEAAASAAVAGAEADLSRFTRQRPDAEAAEASPEEEIAEAVEEAPVEAEAAEDADASRFMRARPATETEAPAETDEVEAAEEASEADISRFTRPRPMAQAQEAEVPTEADRLAAILPSIVTTMGDNRENSYVVDYLEQDPYLVNIYEGYGFAKDYGSARGHEYTLEDVAKTQRPHPKANCITCKTPDLHKMIEEQGVAVYSMPFDEVFPQMTQNVGCYTCHGDDMGAGGALAVTHQYVNEALGENVATINPATLSCGQCHIEYYFTPADSETMMPYHSVEEMTPEAILAYYDAMGFADWTQESTGTAMLKAQHPEMETFLQGKHAAFLSCADCHMPVETTDSGFEYRSHMLVSPLESEALLQSCAQCHGDTDMVSFVHGIQEQVTARETEVGNALSGMKDALAEAVASGQWSEEELNAVRKLHREAQWFFDYCYVENSEGAHNSELSMRCLDTSEAKIEEALQLLNRQTT